MHPLEHAINGFEALKPYRYTSFVRLDVREQYSFDIFEKESLLQLWLQAENEQDVEQPFLHLSCYGVERGNLFWLLWPCYSIPLQLKIKAISQYQLKGMFFEVNYFDTGYDDWSPLFTCRRFEAQLVESSG